jgi:hypothetical protein
MRKSIGELQHMYLSKLLQCNKTMTVSQAVYRLDVLNQYRAAMYINLKEKK